ncbi:hypothetical protein ACTJI8_12895 [Microbacterium sp. 22303]|uniref:hypothetical protein n=1 Tax=Microbacterium sp. 22303 TaxID=3453905 RepID=UPI003F86FC3A
MMLTAYLSLRLFQHSSASDFLVDYVSPIATILLAGAAVVVAVFSWRTSVAANRNSQQNRREDREERSARFRRGIAVDFRAWALASVWRATYGLYYESHDPDGVQIAVQQSKLAARLEREGEENGLRLMQLIQRRLVRINFDATRKSAKDAAKARHPSRMFSSQSQFQPLIDSWVKDPASITHELALDDDAESIAKQARMEALRNWMAKVGSNSEEPVEGES